MSQDTAPQPEKATPATEAPVEQSQEVLSGDDYDAWVAAEVEKAESLGSGDATDEPEPQSSAPVADSDSEPQVASPRAFADVVKREKELRKRTEEINAQQEQLARYVQGLREATSSPERAEALLRNLGIDVDAAVDRIAKHRLGIKDDDTPKQENAQQNQLLNVIQELYGKIENLSKTQSEQVEKQHVRRNVRRVLETVREETPYLAEAIEEDPDILDELVDAAHKSGGRDVNAISELIRRSEQNIESRVEAALSWSLRSPRLRERLGLSEIRSAAPQKRVDRTADDRISAASKEPPGQPEHLTPEDLDRQFMEELLGKRID